MKLRSVICASLLSTVLAIPCVAHHMAIVVDKENSAENVTSTQLSKLFRAEVKKWPDGKNVILVLHKNSAGEAETLKHLTKMSKSEWGKFLEAHKDSVMLAESDADVLKAVSSVPGSIGMVDVRSVDGSIKVVRVDNKLPMESGYLPH